MSKPSPLNMDDMKEKLKALFQAKSRKAFKGRGHVLGSGQVADRPRPESGQSPTNIGAPSEAGQRSRQLSTNNSRRESADGVDGVFRTIGPTDAREVPSSSHTSADGASPSATDALAHPSASDDAIEELEFAVATYLSDGASTPARSVLHKVLQNTAMHPNEPKYRKVRLLNPKIKESITDVCGGIDILRACGFQLVYEPAPAGSGAEEAFAVLPVGKNTCLLQHAARLLFPDAEAPVKADADQPTSASLSSPVEPVKSGDSQTRAPRPRCTQVLLPRETDAQTAAWLLERTPAELKAAYLRSQKKREQESMLMTRAMRERLNERGPARAFKTATVRVRLPEGLVLQGEFDSWEPVAAVFDWVTECLRDPGTAYELIRPDRAVLHASMGTVAAADLAPSTLLIFRCLTPCTRKDMTLREDLVRVAKPA